MTWAAIKVLVIGKQAKTHGDLYILPICKRSQAEFLMKQRSLHANSVPNIFSFRISKI